MKLLVVDDDPDLAALVAFALTNAGYSVVKAGDTAEALRVFDAELPNLVILDINLPSGSGFDVCKNIRGRSAVPIMILTARGEEEDSFARVELGATITSPSLSPARCSRASRRCCARGTSRDKWKPQLSLDLEAHAISSAAAPIASLCSRRGYCRSWSPGGHVSRRSACSRRLCSSGSGDRNC